jgi:hypothetical protein
MGPYNASTIMAMKRTLKVVALPPLVIAGGHVAFHQRLHEVYNVTPFALHYTFQAKFDNTGKLSRVRESNMWLHDPPDPSASKYLTYGNTVQAWIGALDSTWQQHTGKKLAELHKHLLAAGKPAWRQASGGAEVLKANPSRTCTVTLRYNTPEGGTLNICHTLCCYVILCSTFHSHLQLTDQQLCVSLPLCLHSALLYACVLACTCVQPTSCRF